MQVQTTALLMVLEMPSRNKLFMILCKTDQAGRCLSLFTTTSPVTGHVSRNDFSTQLLTAVYFARTFREGRSDCLLDVH